MSLDDLDEFFLLDRNLYLQLLTDSNERLYSVHPINQQRARFGEFHHLYTDLREHPAKFFEYTRMSISTFDYIFSKICKRIQKANTASLPITPPERLFITLRYL